MADAVVDRVPADRQPNGIEPRQLGRRLDADDDHGVDLRAVHDRRRWLMSVPRRTLHRAVRGCLDVRSDDIEPWPRPRAAPTWRRGRGRHGSGWLQHDERRLVSSDGLGCGRRSGCGGCGGCGGRLGCWRRRVARAEVGADDQRQHHGEDESDRGAHLITSLCAVDRDRVSSKGATSHVAPAGEPDTSATSRPELSHRESVETTRPESIWGGGVSESVLGPLSIAARRFPIAGSPAAGCRHRRRRPAEAGRTSAARSRR